MLNVNITKDSARPLLKRLMQSTPAARQVVGKTAATTYQTHFRKLAATRHRAAASFNFYARAANATSWFVQGHSVVVRIANEGIAQRYYGGRIKPKNSRCLTIPTRRAIGKRAGEFNDLFLVWRKGKKTGFLARQEGNALRVYFWLTPEVNQSPDKSVLPKDSTVYSRINTALDAYYSRLERKS